MTATGDPVDTDTLVGELIDWLRIPSVSNEGGNIPAIRRACEWAAERVQAAGGTAEINEAYGNPMVVGELAASRPGAPTVLIYGHADVQGIGDPAAWLSDPFEPEIRGDRIYARGASDDKGNFLPLLSAACAMSRAGDLPVNVRVLIDGEEEVAGAGVGHWIADDDRGADAAIVFDSWMIDEQTPALTIGLRGVVQIHLTIQVNERDLHSGAYGGSVLNAAHVLHGMLAAVLPGPDGRVREELRVGIEEVSAGELAGWSGLPAGDGVLAGTGAHPLYPTAGGDYYVKNWADASLDIGGISLGAQRTVVPAVAHATLSQRLAPNQKPDHVAPILEALLRDAAPPGVQIDMRFDLADPVLFDASSPALQLGLRAIEAGTGMRPAIVRWGGGIPIVANLAQAGIPTIVSGFALDADVPHSPNESFRLESLRLGAVTSRELLDALSSLGITR